MVNFYYEEPTQRVHMLLPFHFLGRLQFQLPKFDCIIIGQEEHAMRGGGTYPMAG